MSQGVGKARTRWEVCQPWIQGLLFVLWGGMGAWVCFGIRGMVGDPPPPTWESLEPGWQFVEWWLYTTLGLLAFILFAGRTNSPGADSTPDSGDGRNVRDRFSIRLGLIAGFALALPGLIIALLALVTTLPDYFSSFVDKDCQIRLDGDGSEKALKPNHFLLAIDAGALDYSNDAAWERSALKKLLTALLAGDQGTTESAVIRSSDNIDLYVFHQQPVPSEEIGKKSMVGGFSQRMGFIWQRVKEMARQASEERSDSWVESGTLEETFTDMILTLRDRAPGLLEGAENVSIILVSDFSVPSSRLGDGMSSRVRDILADIRENQRIRFLGVQVEAKQERKEAPSLLLPLFRDLQANGLDNVIHIREIEEVSEFELKSRLGEALLRIHGVPATTLSYRSSPGWEAFPCQVTLPTSDRHSSPVAILRRSPRQSAFSSALSVRVQKSGGPKASKPSIALNLDTPHALNEFVSPERTFDLSISEKQVTSSTSHLSLVDAKAGVTYLLPLESTRVLGTLASEVFKSALAMLGVALIILAVAGASLHSSNWPFRNGIAGPGREAGRSHEK